MRIPHPAAGNGSADAEDLVRRISHLIESQLPRTISDIAIEFNLSESRLQHVFKQTTGVGLGHRLIEQRLQRAALLLTSSKLKIKEIAASVGYEHVSSFTRAFERRFEQTPVVYRRAGRLPGI